MKIGAERDAATSPLNPVELIDWFAATARPLPWRAPGTTGWGVLVSETMLQQTPVARVQPIWEDRKSVV